MTVRAFTLAVVLLVLSAAPSWAQPGTETVFVDTPGIVDSQPLQFKSWSRADRPDAVRVHFTTGTPECFGVHATVRETPSTVEVALRSGTLPDAVGQACIMIAVFGVLDVPLAGPLGERDVVNG